MPGLLPLQIPWDIDCLCLCHWAVVHGEKQPWVHVALTQQDNLDPDNVQEYVKLNAELPL